MGLLEKIPQPACHRDIWNSVFPKQSSLPSLPLTCKLTVSLSARNCQLVSLLSLFPPYILFAAQLPEWSFKIELRSSHSCDLTFQWLLSQVMKAHWAVWWPLPSDVLSLIPLLEPLSPRGPCMCQTCCSCLWVFALAKTCETC